MRLCLELGYPSPRHLLREITSEELTQWYAFYRLEPWGSKTEDLRTALIAYTVACSIPRKRGSPKPKFEKFLFDYEKRFDQLTTGGSIKDLATGVARAHYALGGRGELPQGLKNLIGDD